MNAQSIYVIEACGARHVVIDPATPRSHSMRRVVLCNQPFTTHEAQGKCPKCGIHFSIDWNGAGAAIAEEEETPNADSPTVSTPVPNKGMEAEKAESSGESQTQMLKVQGA